MKTIIANDHERVGRWACERMGATFAPDVSVAIGLEEDGKLIAGVLYDNYRKKSICMHVAAEGTRWMTKEYLRVCFDYPFRQLGVNKIIGIVGEKNTKARSFDEHLGFELEHIIKDACEDGDMLIYSMTKEQCRHLRIKS